MLIGLLAATGLALSAAPASAAPAAVVEELDGADAPRSELEPLDTVDLPHGAELYRYQQEVDGLPVFGTLAVVADPAEGATSFLATDETEADVDAQPAPDVSRDEAIAIARDATGATDLRGEVTAGLGIEPGDGGGTLAWNLLLPSGKPLADFTVLVDATSGEVLEKGDILQHSIGVQSASALLYRPNPVVENPKRYKGLSDDRDRDSRKLTNLRRPVTLNNLYVGQSCLEGVNVYATNGITEVCSSSTPLDFSEVRRRSNKFEALMAYYHIDRTLVYLNGPNVQAGLTPGLEIDYGGGTIAGQQDVRANYNKKDNSFYSPSTLFIGLGSGGVDDGEDGDVIVHEYGHSIHDDQIPGPGANGEGSFADDNFEGNAMGEGFGDYLSAVMSQRYAEAEGLTTISNKDNVCIFDWDGLSYSRNGCGRSASDESDYFQQGFQCGASIHCFGQAWSSALWALRSADEQGLSIPNSALGTTMDKIVLASHYLLNENSDVEDASFALLEADETLHPAGIANDGQGQNYQALIDELVCRDFISGSCF